jgi:hypothetical protein
MNLRNIINEAILVALVEDNFDLPDMDAKSLKLAMAAAKKHKLKTKTSKGSRSGLTVLTVIGNTKQIDQFMGSLQKEEVDHLEEADLEEKVNEVAPLVGLAARGAAGAAGKYLAKKATKAIAKKVAKRVAIGAAGAAAGAATAGAAGVAGAAYAAKKAKDKMKYKAQKSKTQKKSFSSMRGRLANELDEKVVQTGTKKAVNPNVRPAANKGIARAPRLNKRKPFTETTLAATKKGINVTGPDGKTRTVMKSTKVKNYDGEQDKIRSGKSRSVWDKE